MKQYLTDEAQQSREQDDKALEDLLNTNAQLYDQIDELKKKCKDYVDPAEHTRLLDQLKDFENQKEHLLQEKRDLMKKSEGIQKEKDSSQEELVKYKIDKQKAQVELNKANQSMQAQKLEYEEKVILMQTSIRDIEGKLKAEVEQRLVA